jgi:hypothetical protein
MRHLEPPRTKLDRKLDHAREPFEVLTVHHGVDRERQPRGAHQGGGAAFEALRVAEAGDPVALGIVNVLEADLNVVESGFDECRDARLVEHHGGRNEVRIEPGARGMTDEMFEIAPCGRLAAREMHLQGAERGCFVDDPAPGRGIELAACAVELQRV